MIDAAKHRPLLYPFFLEGIAADSTSNLPAPQGPAPAGQTAYRVSQMTDLS